MLYISISIQGAIVKYTKEMIQDMLAHSDKAVLKGLLRIYSLQTASEQDVEYTKEHNGVGFSGYDGNFMTSLAKGFIQYGRLTPKQMVHARKKMKRYAGQLAKIANGEIECPPLPQPRGHKFTSTPPAKTYEEIEREAIQEESKLLKQPLEW